MRARAAGVVAGHAADRRLRAGRDVDRKPEAVRLQLRVQRVEHDAGLDLDGHRRPRRTRSTLRRCLLASITSAAPVVWPHCEVPRAARQHRHLQVARDVDRGGDVVLACAARTRRPASPGRSTRRSRSGRATPASNSTSPWSPSPAGRRAARPAGLARAGAIVFAGAVPRRRRAHEPPRQSGSVHAPRLACRGRRRRARIWSSTASRLCSRCSTSSRRSAAPSRPPSSSIIRSCSLRPRASTSPRRSWSESAAPAGAR